MGVCCSSSKNNKQNNKTNNITISNNNTQPESNSNTFPILNIKNEVSISFTNLNNNNNNYLSYSPYHLIKPFHLSSSNNTIPEEPNLSINDEFPSNSTRNVPLNPPHNFQHNNNNNNNSSDSLTDRTDHYCNRCNQNFNSLYAYEKHLRLCNEVQRNVQISNSLNEIIHLVHDFNQELSNRNTNMMNILSGLNNEIEDNKEYLDWEFDEKTLIWKNKGKIYVNNIEMERIEKLSFDEIKTKKFYIKRIWFIKFINKNLYEKNIDNSPLVINRDKILEESFNQFNIDDLNLKRNMHIYFIDEIAKDVGGVYREWYSCLFKEIFEEKKNNFFKLNNNEGLGKQTYIIPFIEKNDIHQELLDYYKFIGKIIGKALFDKITINYNLNQNIIKLLLGIKEFNIEDLKYYDIEIYKSLINLKNSNFSNNNDLYFTWEINGKIYEIIPNGKNILIDNNNKDLFLNTLPNFICYESIKQQINSLLQGFNILFSNKNQNYNYILNIFNLNEFNFLLSGQNKVDLNDWKKNTVYKGYYNENYITIKYFWEILGELNQNDLIHFYKFCTGNSSVPIDGFIGLQATRNKVVKFCIQSQERGESNKRLIEAKTCFNRIILPEYDSKEEMKKAIETIVNNDTNFFGLQ